MGSGERMYRMAYGAATAESKAIQEHELAMLDISAKTFEQQLEQAKQISTLIDELDKKGKATAQPIYVTQEALETKKPNYILYAGIAIIAFILLKGKK